MVTAKKLIELKKHKEECPQKIGKEYFKWLDAELLRAAIKGAKKVPLGSYPLTDAGLIAAQLSKAGFQFSFKGDAVISGEAWADVEVIMPVA